MIYPIEIINNNSKKKYIFITKLWKLKNKKNTHLTLIITPKRIELKNNLNKNIKNIWIDFNYQKYIIYKKEKKRAIIKAIGIKKNYTPHILDGTAGFGKDAFIFFSKGCKVTMIEKNPILSILLYDALHRSFQNHKIGFLIKKNIQLIYNDTLNIKKLKILQPDVIYLDPMFPKKNKISLPKKNMQIIQQLVGNDLNSNYLFNQCKKVAKNRIVVKRPINSKYINNNTPNFKIKTKKYRFDVYLVKN